MSPATPSAPCPEGPHDRRPSRQAAGIDTVLVLSSITKESDLDAYAYRPHYILHDVSGISA